MSANGDAHGAGVWGMDSPRARRNHGQGTRRCTVAGGPRWGGCSSCVGRKVGTVWEGGAHRLGGCPTLPSLRPCPQESSRTGTKGPAGGRWLGARGRSEELGVKRMSTPHLSSHGSALAPSQRSHRAVWAPGRVCVGVSLLRGVCTEPFPAPAPGLMARCTGPGCTGPGCTALPAGADAAEDPRSQAEGGDSIGNPETGAGAGESWFAVSSLLTFTPQQGQLGFSGTRRLWHTVLGCPRGRKMSRGRVLPQLGPRESGHRGPGACTGEAPSACLGQAGLWLLPPSSVPQILELSE